MKYLLTPIFLFIASFLSAQVVNIPDPAFKQSLIDWGVDVNHNGEIETSEALARTSLTINNSDIQNLTGIEAFQNLGTLGVAMILTNANIDFGNMPSLEYLSISDGLLQTINITGCTNLKILKFWNVNSTSATNPMSLLVGHLTRLKTIYTDGTVFGPLDLTGCDSLQRFKSSPLNMWSFANQLNISGLTQLDSLYNISVNGLVATNCTGLKSITTSGGAQPFGAFFNVTGCTNLREIHISGTYNTLTKMDLSTCTNLKTLILEDVTPLTDINIKNGHYLDSLVVNSLSNIMPLNICVDDFALDSVTHMLYRNLYAGNQRSFNISPYCTFFPGGNYNTITGTTKLDLNNNGCDNGDAGFSNMPIKINNTSGDYLVRYTLGNGTYTHYCQAGDFTITPYFPYPYFDITPTSAIVNFPTVNSATDTEDFCITPAGIHNDLVATLLPLSAGRFNTNIYQLVYRNRGNTILSGNVQLNFDNSKMGFNSSSVAVSSQSTGLLTWNFSNLLPFESRTITVFLSLFAPPVNNIGDTIFLIAGINPVIEDETPADNNFILPVRVVGGYDPNDKQCLQGSKLDIVKVGTALDYLIRFQNVGNDTAFNIVVVDTLSNNLDWNSFEITGISHPCDIKQTNGKLEFYFKDIQLPYQAINDAGSNGYVAFKIKTKNNLVIGDSVNNKAAIYFDFNLPVITNTATTIVSPTSPLAVKLEYFSLATKNEKNLLTWKSPSTTGTTNFGIERSNDGIHFNNFGNITASVDRCQLPFNFTDENPFDGKTYYRLNIKDADGNSFYSKVLVAGRSKSGLSINAVVSDRNNTTIYLDASKAQNVQIKIIAADGRLMCNQNKTIEAGNSTLNLPLNNLATGIYTLLVYTELGESITKRFIK
ncbi:MAG: T9SS type A sorting domain-containing protein [Ferruginibacter sp.]